VGIAIAVDGQAHTKKTDTLHYPRLIGSRQPSPQVGAPRLQRRCARGSPLRSAVGV